MVVVTKCLQGRKREVQKKKKRKRKKSEMHFKRNMVSRSGQIPLWSEGGTLGVASIITGIMRGCSRERGILELNESDGLATACFKSSRCERGGYVCE